ncbi:MAG: Xaa-His dipeptidase [Sarcina sp.]
MGRNSIDEELESQLSVIITMVKDNRTDKEIVERLGISPSTWKRKKAQNKKIKQAIEEALDSRNEEVEEALFKNCIGYKYYEEVVTKVKNEIRNEDGSITIQEDVKISNVKKYKGPDLAAQKYYLNNRSTGKWKDDPNKTKHDKELLKLKKKELESKEW